RCCEDLAKPTSVSEYQIPRNNLLNRLRPKTRADWRPRREASTQLLQLQPGVHQRGTIWQELESRDNPEKPAGCLLDLRLSCPVISFRLREVPNDTREQFLRRLDDAALVVFFQVPLLEDTQCVLGQFWIWLTGHDLEGPRFSDLDLFHGTTSARQEGAHAKGAVRPSLGGGAKGHPYHSPF